MAEWRAIHQPTKISHAIWFKFKVPLRLSKYWSEGRQVYNLLAWAPHAATVTNIPLFGKRVSASPKSPQLHLPFRTGLSGSYQPPPKAAESTVWRRAD